MCSIAKSLTGSIAGQAPNSTMLGGAAVGTGPMGPGAKRVAGGLSSTMLGAGGSGSSPDTGGGSPRANPRNPKLQMMQE